MKENERWRSRGSEWKRWQRKYRKQRSTIEGEVEQERESDGKGSRGNKAKLGEGE